MLLEKNDIIKFILLVVLLVGCTNAKDISKGVLLTNGKIGDYSDYFGMDYSFTNKNINILDFKEYGVDTNSNGLFDRVDYELTISIPEEGEYSFVLDIMDISNEKNLAGTPYTIQNLTKGINTVRMSILSKELFHERSSKRYIFTLRLFLSNSPVYSKWGFFATNYFIEKFEQSLPNSTNEQGQFEQCKNLLTKKIEDYQKEMEKYVEQTCFEYSESGMMDEILEELRETK